MSKKSHARTFGNLFCSAVAGQGLVQEGLVRLTKDICIPLAQLELDQLILQIYNNQMN